LNSKLIDRCYMLKGHELKEVIDQFKYLGNPNIRNVISSFCSNNHRSVIDNIITIKKELKFKFIHDNVFLGQRKEKVYIFKMFIKGPGSRVDLVRHMQLGGDLENAWIMFDPWGVHSIVKLNTTCEKKKIYFF